MEINISIKVTCGKHLAATERNNKYAAVRVEPLGDKKIEELQLETPADNIIRQWCEAVPKEIGKVLLDKPGGQ